MALKTLVKVGGITNLSDARYCAGMGVDFLGFSVIDGQPNMISPKSFQEIRGWVTGPQIVAELYGIQNPEIIPAILEHYQPDYFEFSIGEYNRVASAITLPFILMLKEGEELPAFLGAIPAYILTDLTSASGKIVPDHEILVPVTTTEDLPRILRQTGISGISLNGGFEIKPGLKSYDEISGILEALEED